MLANPLRVVCRKRDFLFNAYRIKYIVVYKTDNFIIKLV